MLATYGAALLIVIASLYVGRALFALFGRRETLWLETPVGLAFLIVICSVLTRAPGHATTALVVCAALVGGSILFLRLSFADRESLLIGLPVALLTLLLASLPFIASGHVGIPGVGVNNDMAAHLIWADWLADPTGRTPIGIELGYPIGPHGLAATVSKAVGTEPLYGFLALLLALPVITGLASLNLLSELRPAIRSVAASLVALPFMAASTLGIAGFKELAVGVFLLAFVLILRELTRQSEGRLALVVALGVLAAGTVASFSYPGLVWPAAAGGIWVALELLRAVREGRMGELRTGARRARGLIVVGVLALGALLVAELPRLIDLRRSGLPGIVTDTDSKLRFDLSPLETLGAWPSGEFLFGTTGLDAWELFGALGLIALLFAVIWWLRRADLALPAGVAGAAIVYLGTVAVGGRYVESKALAVPAALVMLLILGALLLRGGSRARAVLAVPFIAIAAYSSFLALRDSVVAPTDRFDELREMRGTVEGEEVIDLTTDRFTSYYLRGAEVLSPARNAEEKIGARSGKDFRLPVDFDSVFAETLDLFDYAVTTSTAYQSMAPTNWGPVERSDSYVLWRRNGRTPTTKILAEASRPGRIFRCGNPKFRHILEQGGTALVWPRPRIAKRLFWEPDNELEPGETASQTINFPPGEWELAIQYSSPVVDVVVEADGLRAEVPPGVEGAIPFRPDQGPFFQVGRMRSEGGPVEITVRAGELSTLQEVLGVDAPVAVGNVTAVRVADVYTTPVGAACGLYVDHVTTGFSEIGRIGPSRTGKEPVRAQQGAGEQQ